MDLRQVGYVLAVVDHGGFTRAARAIHVAQPSLSQSVRRLEEELGAPLFFRIGRTTRLTDAGAAFVGPARRLLREAQNVVAAVAGHAGLEVGSLDIVALPTLVADPLAAVIGRFRALHPGVVVRVLDPPTAAGLLAMVGDGRAEIGITEAGPTPHGITRRYVSDQELLAVLPPGSVTRSGKIRLDVFARHPLIVGPPGTSTRQVLEHALQDLGIAPIIAVETGQREAITPLVLTGAGATVLPAPLAKEAEASGAVVAGFSRRLRRPVTVVYRSSEVSPAASEFLELLLATRSSSGRESTALTKARLVEEPRTAVRSER